MAPRVLAFGISAGLLAWPLSVLGAEISGRETWSFQPNLEGDDESDPTKPDWVPHSLEEVKKMGINFYGQGKYISEMIREQARNGSNVCVTLKGTYGGGLANTVGYVNAMVDFAVTNGAKFVVPKIVPPDHEVGDHMANLFGPQDDCISKLIAWHAECREGSFWVHPHEDRIYFPNEEHDVDKIRTHEGRCAMEYTTVFTNGRYVHAQACGCDNLVVVNTGTMIWTPVAAASRKVLMRRYWNSHAEYVQIPGTDKWTPENFPFTAVMHVRLGDAADLKLKKYRGPERYVDILAALKLTADPKCYQIVMVTDGLEWEQDIQFIKQSTTQLGYNQAIVLDNRTAESVAFDLLTHADVLLGGTSGFVRLARRVAKDITPGILIDLEDDPLWDIPNTTYLGFMETKGSDWELAKNNEGLKALAAKCQQWRSSASFLSRHASRKA